MPTLPSLNRLQRRAMLASLGIGSLAVPLGTAAVRAASHREAPLISLDPAADITDFFMFRSYQPGRGDRIVFVMDVFPGGEPSSGPNYFTFDPDVRYAIHIDNDADGKADDVEFQFEFKNEIRGTVDAAGLFLSYVALPPITALDGPGSEGLGFRQRYSVTLVRNGKRQQIADGKFVVPSNVGPRTTPNYDALAAQGIYTLNDDVRVFVGQRSDPFYIDLGGVFDTLNLRRNPPLLTPAEDANDNANPFGIDMIGTYNVQTIAIEVAASLLTRDSKKPSETKFPKLGAYASTSRQRLSVLSRAGRENDGRSLYVQVQRLANPLVNEAIIGTEDKDRWNATEPNDEAAFLDYYLNPRLALALELVYGVTAAQTGRQDLVDLLLKYAPGDKTLSELLRLDISKPAIPFAAQKRMTVFADPQDLSGWPNGRRPKDDVTDIAVRAIGGPNYIAGRAGDGVNKPFRTLPDPNVFPFLATPQNGRDRVHQNP